MDKHQQVLKEQSIRMAEASSKYSHEVAGKLHIIQFCIDEILEENEELNDNRLMKKVVKSLDELNDAVSFYREYLLTELDSNSCTTILEGALKADKLLKLYHWKRVRFVTIHRPVDDLDCSDAWNFAEILLSLYTYCLETIECNENKNIELDLRYCDLDSEAVEVTLLVKGESLEIDKILTFYEMGGLQSKRKRCALGFKEAMNKSLSCKVTEKGTLFTLKLKK